MELRVIFLVLLLVWPQPRAMVHAKAPRFFFPNFVPDPKSNAGLITLGSSFELYGQLQLTPDNEMTPAPMSVGKAFYAQKIRMLDPTTKQAASFSTYFTFSINNLSCSRQLCGDGIAFLLSPDDHSLGEYGGNLGIYNSSTANGARPKLANTLAVEFDTHQNLDSIRDIDNNHVGINLESATSKVAVSADSVDINLKDGTQITAWIDYESANQSLQVRIGPNASNKPLDALIDYKVDLTNVVNEFMYVGFAAATGIYYELHTIYSWSFTGQAQEPLSPPAAATNLVPDRSATNDGSQSTPGSRPSSPSKVSLSRVLPGLVVGLPVASALIILICAAFLLGKRRKLWLSGRTRESAESAAERDGSFRYKQLSVATQGFSDKMMLGSGSGKVYKGVLAATGELVAVKRIRELNPKREKEVYVELSALTRLQHRNLVPLLGWCRDRGKYILVYEFMPGGSLTKALYEDIELGEPLSWPQRFNIVTGLSDALNYLHGGPFHQQVIHQNVKPSSVLLDENYNARLGDYCLFGEKIGRKGERAPESERESFGYIAPEISTKGSMKGDVYSFGSLVLEVVCGRRPIEAAFPAEELFIVDWVTGLYCEGRITAAVDKRLGANFEAEQAQAVLLVGLLCCQPDPEQRPSMRQVLKYLSRKSPIPPAPRPLSSLPAAS